METDLTAFEADIRSAQSGDRTAEQRLLESNMPLVFAIAKRYMHRGVDSDDLRQIGSIGLLKAIRRFDLALNVCFSTYAVPLIAGEIKRFLRDDGIIKFSRSAKQLAAAVTRALSEEPDLRIEDLSDRLLATREEIAVALASANSVASLDEPINDTDENRFDRIGTENQEESCVKRLSLQSAISTLSERDQLLIHLRYHEEKTQSEVGQLLGVSQVQVSRIEKKILSDLRGRMCD